MASGDEHSNWADLSASDETFPDPQRARHSSDSWDSAEINESFFAELADDQTMGFTGGSNTPIIMADADGTLWGDPNSPYGRSLSPAISQKLQAWIDTEDLVFCVNSSMSFARFEQAFGASEMPVWPHHALLSDAEIFHLSGPGLYVDRHPFNEDSRRVRREAINQIVPHLSKWIKEWGREVEIVRWQKQRLQLVLQCETPNDAAHLRLFIEDWLRSRGYSDLAVMQNLRMVVVTSAAYSKGNLIRELMQENGWRPGQILAVGDDVNDLPMMQPDVAVPACVANATAPVVKAVEQGGGYRSKRYYDAGVIDCIEWFIERLRDQAEQIASGIVEAPATQSQTVRLDSVSKLASSQETTRMMGLASTAEAEDAGIEAEGSVVEASPDTEEEVLAQIREIAPDAFGASSDEADTNPFNTMPTRPSRGRRGERAAVARPDPAGMTQLQVPPPTAPPPRPPISQRPRTRRDDRDDDLTPPSHFEPPADEPSPRQMPIQNAIAENALSSEVLHANESDTGPIESDEVPIVRDERSIPSPQELPPAESPTDASPSAPASGVSLPGPIGFDASDELSLSSSYEALPEATPPKPAPSAAAPSKPPKAAPSKPPEAASPPSPVRPPSDGHSRERSTTLWLLAGAMVLVVSAVLIAVMWING